MSVNNTVRRARRDGDGAAWLPVRNSSNSVRSLSGSASQGTWSSPSTSSNRAPGMWSAIYRPSWTGMISSREWTTRVGVVIVGRMGRTSVRNTASSVARAIPGLALMRSTIPSWRIDAHRCQQTFECRTAAPRRARGAEPSLPAGELLHRGCVVLTQLRHEARPQLGRIAVKVVPPLETEVREAAGEDQRPRSLRSCCREHDGGRAALAATEDTALSKPATSMTASISAARSSSVRTCGTGSDNPTPALSNRRTRQNVESRSKKATNSGMAQYSSM